jgi:hypothetical protein
MRRLHVKPLCGQVAAGVSGRGSGSARGEESAWGQWREEIRFPHVTVVKGALGYGRRPRPRLILRLPGRGQGS